uniref:Uncharacterized protein n=1 Tax=Arundo donax TaxID=35708 RepID=A0A0A8Y429_ARUDO
MTWCISNLSYHERAFVLICAKLVGQLVLIYCSYFNWLDANFLFLYDT